MTRDDILAITVVLTSFSMREKSPVTVLCLGTNFRAGSVFRAAHKYAVDQGILVRASFNQKELIVGSSSSNVTIRFVCNPNRTWGYDFETCFFDEAASIGDKLFAQKVWNRIAERTDLPF